MAGVARLLPALAAAVLIVAGFAAVIVFFGARDESGIEQPAPSAATSSDAVLAAGNVRLEYGDAAQATPARRLAEQLGAVDSPAARAAGQALIIRRSERLATGVRLQAARAELTAATVDDPAVAAFVRQHLGRTE